MTRSLSSMHLLMIAASIGLYAAGDPAQADWWGDRAKALGRGFPMSSLPPIARPGVISVDVGSGPDLPTSGMGIVNRPIRIPLSPPPIARPGVIALDIGSGPDLPTSGGRIVNSGSSGIQGSDIGQVATGIFEAVAVPGGGFLTEPNQPYVQRGAVYPSRSRQQQDLMMQAIMRSSGGLQSAGPRRYDGWFR